MKEWCKLLQNIKYNKNEFITLIDWMNPLISKYVRLLYKDEPEDIREELLLALWESVLKIDYCNNDGECLSYINNALRNKFLELYRKSKKQHDFQSTLELEEIPDSQNLKTSSVDFSDIIFREDIKHLFPHATENKQQLFKQILLEGKSDAEIAKSFDVSRQYINRLRNKLYSHLKKYYYEEKSL